jgi:hypothetical protein
MGVVLALLLTLVGEFRKLILFLPGLLHCTWPLVQRTYLCPLQPPSRQKRLAVLPCM